MTSTRPHTRWHVAVALLLAALFAPRPATAGKTPKGYPEEGKITATAINQVPVVRYQSTGPNGTTMPVKGVSLSRTYTVQTATKTYELDCGKHPHMFSKTPGECGGDKKLQIGDVIHFRIEKGSAYIPVPSTVEPSGEQKLRVINEELTSDDSANPPAAKPPDAKP